MLFQLQNFAQNFLTTIQYTEMTAFISIIKRNIHSQFEHINKLTKWIFIAVVLIILHNQVDFSIKLNENDMIWIHPNISVFLLRNISINKTVRANNETWNSTKYFVVTWENLNKTKISQKSKYVEFFREFHSFLSSIRQKIQANWQALMFWHILYRNECIQSSLLLLSLSLSLSHEQQTVDQMEHVKPHAYESHRV